MAKHGKGESKGRGEKDGQGGTSKAAPKPEPRPLVGKCQLPGVAAGAGRPTDYRPEYCDHVKKLGRKGYSKAMIAYDLDVVRSTLDNWASQNPEFLDAINHARELALGWWEAQGHQGIWSRDFNANAYRLQVTNRFPDDWKDKQTQELTGKDGESLNVAITFVKPNGD